MTSYDDEENVYLQECVAHIKDTSKFVWPQWNQPILQRNWWLFALSTSFVLWIFVSLAIWIATEFYIDWAREFLVFLIIWIGCWSFICLRMSGNRPKIEYDTHQTKPFLVREKCPFCGALYIYPESRIDVNDYCVECQNCAKRIPVTILGYLLDY